MPATERYVSIGAYMPPFGIMALPIVIKALAMWITYSFSENSLADEEKETDNKESTEESTKKDRPTQKDEKVR